MQDAQAQTYDTQTKAKINPVIPHRQALHPRTPSITFSGGQRRPPARPPLHSLAASDVQRGKNTQSTNKLDGKPYTKKNEVKWRATSRHLG